MRVMALLVGVMGLGGCIFDATASASFSRPTVVVSGGASANANAGVAGGVCQCVQGAREVCNGCDDNCNGAVDEDCQGGGGGAVVAQPVQTQPAPAVCTCVQGARERCNGCDDNCNGAVDEDCM